MAPVEVTYTLADIYAVTLHSWRTYAFRILILFGILMVIFIVLLLLDGATIRESLSWFPFGLYLGLAAFLLAFLMGVAPLISYFRSKRQGTLGPNHIIATDEGVRIDGPKGQSLVYWSAFQRIVIAGNRLLLFIGPVQAFVFPKRVFPDEASFAACVKEAEARWRNAKSVTVE